MRTIEHPGLPAALKAGGPAAARGRKHFGPGVSRQITWRVVGSTVAGLPAFLWQLAKTRSN